MSNWREQLGGEEETRALADWLVEYYHYPVLTIFVLFAFWNRIRNYSNFIVNGEILYSGNDPWYHMRSTEYVINNFPQTMPFDPWTYFPNGTASSQFGTLFDQLIALVALVVGLGDPGEGTGRLVILIAPAVFGVLVCVPVYLIGHRLGDRFGGLVAVAFVAFAPDRLLAESLAGTPDHQVAEALFMGLAVLALMVALRAAERELPVHELLVQRELGLLRGTLGWSLLAGVAFGVYLWVWPPGVWLYGIFGTFFLVHMMAEHVRGRSPEHTAFVGVVLFATAGLLQLATVQVIDISATDRSLLQPGFGLVLAGGIVGLARLSRAVDSRDVSPLTYPAGVVGSLVVGLALVAVLLPGTFSFFLSQFDRAFGALLNWTDTAVFFLDISVGGQGAEATIGEGTPGDIEDIRNAYQFATFTALLGAGVLLGKQFGARPKAEELLVLVVSVFLVVATFTQIRFGYYLVLAVAPLNAALVGFVMRLAGTPDSRTLPETYQILTVAVIVFVMFVPLFGLPIVGGDQTAMGLADDRSQPGDVVGWTDSLEWMSENTPEPGLYGNPDGEPLEYYGEYKRPGNFEYPEGSYGVLSWWDYGHWITAEGERIPDANPFQQNTDPAAEFLLAQNESEGLDVLDEQLSDPDAQTRYVMVDALMVETSTRVGGKFFAPPAFTPEYERGDFYRIMTSDLGAVGIAHKQAYYDSMMVRLYRYHGSQKQPEPFVTQWTGQESRTEDGDAVVSVPQDTDESPVVQFEDDLSAAQNRSEGDQSNQIGGIGPHPSEEVPALEHFRLVYADGVPTVPGTGGNDTAWQEARGNGLNTNLAALDLQRRVPLLQNAANNSRSTQEEQLDFLHDTTPSFTKTFERVPGATIEASLPENASNDVVNVTAGDELGLSVTVDPENGESFTYSQSAQFDESLTADATVPYSTTGYDEYGVEAGYTNVSARAEGPYTVETRRVFDDNNSQFVWYGADVNVTEGQVIGEEDGTVEVELERRTQEFNFGGVGGGGALSVGESESRAATAAGGVDRLAPTAVTDLGLRAV